MSIKVKAEPLLWVEPEPVKLNDTQRTFLALTHLEPTVDTWFTKKFVYSGIAKTQEIANDVARLVYFYTKDMGHVSVKSDRKELTLVFHWKYQDDEDKSTVYREGQIRKIEERMLKS